MPKDINVSLSELKTILDVNTKSIEIYIEVEKQNEEILLKLNSITSDITKIKENQDKINYVYEFVKDTLKTKITDLDKNIFRLVILLGSAGIGTIIAIIRSFVH